MRATTAPLSLLGILLLAGCAGTAQDDSTPGLVRVPPDTVAADPLRYQGWRVEWGGQIVAVHNLRNRTELEVLAYPLSSSGRPDAAATPEGRFLAVRGGFLEPADYAPGRLVTVSGVVGPAREGSVGEARHLYPTISAEVLRLWDAEPPGYSGPVPFGTIGIGVGSGGWRGGGVGIGIGF
jgi:outer membrane lipoprotein